MSDPNPTEAEDLLRQIQDDDVRLPYAIKAWSWRPFQTPSDEELKELERLRLFTLLSTEADYPARVKLATQLLQLGGYRIEEGGLELTEYEFLFLGQCKRVDKLEDSDDFRKVFDSHIRWWRQDGQPDWPRIGDLLLRYKILKPTELEDLTLVAIRRCLPLLSEAISHQEKPIRVSIESDPILEYKPAIARELAVPPPSPREEAATTTEYVWKYDKENWFITFRDENGVFPDEIGFQYYAHILASTSPTRHLTGLEVVQAASGSDGQTYAVESAVHVTLDADALADYRRQLREDEAQLEVERRKTTPDKSRIKELEESLAFIRGELKSSTGLRGQSRHFTGPRQQLADSVRKALARARSKIDEKGLVKLVEHLRDVQNEKSAFHYRRGGEINWEVTVKKPTAKSDE